MRQAYVLGLEASLPVSVLCALEGQIGVQNTLYNPKNNAALRKFDISPCCECEDSSDGDAPQDEKVTVIVTQIYEYNSQIRYLFR